MSKNIFTGPKIANAINQVSTFSNVSTSFTFSFIDDELERKHLREKRKKKLEEILKNENNDEK